jgi:hypothetical protein
MFIPYGLALGKTLSQFLPFLYDKDLTNFLLLSLGIALISSLVGVPIISNINSI